METAEIPGQDLYGSLNDKLQGLPCCAPDKSIGAKPKVIEIRPKLFHSEGLFPLDVECPQVMAPSIFSPTKWVR
jgi:hypothetical protein